jgi:hypothetical protein
MSSEELWQKTVSHGTINIDLKSETNEPYKIIVPFNHRALNLYNKVLSELTNELVRLKDEQKN